MEQNNNAKIPLKGQLEPTFYGPPIADLMVNTVNDLVTTKYNYLHKIIWVVSDKCWYYLYKEPSNPISINDWRKVTQNASLPKYSPSLAYTAGEAVYFGFSNDYMGETKWRYKIYTCLEAATPGQTPVTHPQKWLCLSDDTLGIRMEFINQSTILVDTQDIIIPVFQVYVNNSSGLPEICFPRIVRNVNGTYLISFYQSNNLIPKSGFFYIK